MSITATILEQLGGGRIWAMAFDAQRSSYGPNLITLRIAAGLVKSAKDRATHVVIRLEVTDTYTVEVLRYPRGKVEGLVVGYQEGVYADQLKSVVELMTGLRLSL